MDEDCEVLNFSDSFDMVSSKILMSNLHSQALGRKHSE